MKTPELEVYNDLLLGAFVSPVVDKKNGLRLARDLCTKLAVREHFQIKQVTHNSIDS